jgi:hypothetical protein
MRLVLPFMGFFFYPEKDEAEFPDNAVFINLIIAKQRSNRIATLPLHHHVIIPSPFYSIAQREKPGHSVKVDG